MRSIVVVLFLAVAVCPISIQAESQSPIGDWSSEFRIAARDQGVCYLSFSNDFSCTGYGISEDSYGVFPITGTWFLDSNGRTVVALTFQLSSGGRAISAMVVVTKNGRFKGNGTTPDGRRVSLKGSPAYEIPDMSGIWNAETRTLGGRFYETYTLSASTNQPGVFEIDGAGNGSQGAYDLSGAVMPAARRGRLSGVITSNYGSVFELTAELSGRLNGKLSKFKLKGRFGNDSHNITIKAERP